LLPVAAAVVVMAAEVAGAELLEALV